MSGRERREWSGSSNEKQGGYLLNLYFKVRRKLLRIIQFLE
jgi:hypothetical protein